MLRVAMEDRGRRRRSGAQMLRPRRVAVILLALTVAGGCLRFESAGHPSRYQSVDERAYARLAIHLVDAHSYQVPMFTDPTRWAPGGPAMFALAQRLHPLKPEPGRLDVPVGLHLPGGGRDRAHPGGVPPRGDPRRSGGGLWPPAP
jgi:hypothetical protein